VGLVQALGLFKVDGETLRGARHAHPPPDPTSDFPLGASIPRRALGFVALDYVEQPTPGGFMSNGPKFSGTVHAIFAELMGDDRTTIERILGRRVLGVQPNLHARIKEHGGYTKIPREAIPWRANDPLTGREQEALERRAATARHRTRRARA
jgi:hypothetical protein